MAANARELRVGDEMLTGKSVGYDEIVSVELGVIFRAWDFCCHSARDHARQRLARRVFWISRTRAAVLRSLPGTLKDVGNVTPVSMSFRPQPS